MKVRITYTVEVDKETRQGIWAYHNSNPGIASREDVKHWFWLFGQSMRDDIPEPNKKEE